MNIRQQPIRATQVGVDPHLPRPDHGDRATGDK